MNRLLLHIPILAALTLIVANVGYAGDSKLPDVLNELTGNLHSDILKELCVQQYSLMKELDSAKVKGAIDFFHDLRAQAVLLDFLKSKNFIVKAYAMEAIRDIAQLGDKELVQSIINQLESLVGSLHTGGSEVQIPLEEYRNLLLDTLEKTTKLDMMGIKRDSDESIRAFLIKAKQWLAQQAGKP